MANKKNGFWTFIFSLIPGAGEMYMGFFKQGLSLMGLCAIVSIVASFLGIEELMILLPLIWFYSFFHVHHLRSLPPEEFHAMEDKILFFDDRDFQLGTLTENRKKAIAVVLVVVGVILLWNSVLDLFGWILPDFFREILWSLQNLLPRLAIAVLILYAGVRMLRGTPVKKEDVEDEDEDEEV